MELREQLQSSLGATYKLERELGGGGMSRVFVAEDKELGRDVVVKVLAPELAAGISAERFAREVRLAAQLQQANIVPVLSAGEAAAAPGDSTSMRLPYYTMPFVEGESLRARLTAHGPLPIAEAVSVLRDIARALVHAHGRGIVHRDIKPENVLLSGGTGMVTDFGIAKALVESRTSTLTELPADSLSGLTQIGTALGTPAYMAPEQIAGDPSIDHRADLYSFGCLAYELLTGAPPFGRRPVHDLLRAHLSEVAPPVTAKRAEIPQLLATLVTRCLEKSPAARPQSAREVLEAIDGVAIPAARHAARGRSVLFAVAPTLLLLAGGAWYLTRHRGAPNAVHTIAVIPLVSADADPAQEYFSDGITEDVTTALSQVPGLSVISRGSAYQFKGRAIDANEVKKKLAVDHIVEVSVRRIDSGVQVNVDLVDASTGIVVWSKPFARDAGKVPGVRDEITTAVIDELQIRLTGGAPRRRHEPKPAAYEAYLRGRWFLNRAGREDLEHALENFGTAAALDPAFPEPLAAAASAWQMLADAYVTPLEAYPHADSLSRRALALDETLAEAHTTMAFTRLALHWDWTGAQGEFERALALNPNDALTRQNYSIFWSARGDIARAVAEAERAARADPLSVMNLFLLSWYRVWLGQPDSALAVTRRVDELSPGFSYGEWSAAGDAFRMKGMLDSALARDREASNAIGYPSSGLVASLLALGRRPEAERAARELEASGSKRYIAPESIARAKLVLGDTAGALRFFERGADLHSAAALIIGHYAEVRGLRSVPRYQRVRERIGLPR